MVPSILPAPRGGPYLEQVLLSGVVGMGQAVPSLPVLAVDKVPSLLSTGIWVESLGGGKASSPKPVGSVISQHDEKLQESPTVTVSTRASREEQGAWCPCITQGAAAPSGEAAWPLSTVCQPQRPAPRASTCTISLDQTLVSSFRLCTLEMLEPRLRCCPAGSRRVSTP